MKNQRRQCSRSDLSVSFVPHRDHDVHSTAYGFLYHPSLVLAIGLNSALDLTRSPYRLTSRVRSSTARCGPPLPSPSRCVRPWLEWNWGPSGAIRRQRKKKTRRLLEERVERDAWWGALDAFTRLMDARRAVEAEAQPREG